ncbi:hypothetical protein BRADI_1g32977v3 [Brachypodium distachyon]|uniref:C3H1-type domain-containing protein n=2 Tax=Brachypodium distachyon TaxID=15368 RepID=A0A0Q3JYX6_BRADI|nr:hypothetical protein BRADI_1g32977v3 [Brachypodium distachyon]
MREMADPPPHRGPAYKTKLCALWQRSHHCPRGASCGFAHGGAELRKPPPHSSFPPRIGPPGRRDHRTHDFRGRPERRNSPRGRYSPERDTRGHLFHGQNRRPSSRDRGSSHSRSPINKSERRHKKKVDGEKTDSSGSFSTSDNEDRKKDDTQSSGDEKDRSEAQLKQIALDLKLKALREDKSKLQATLDKKIDETGILSTRVDDLEVQLNKEKQNCERMTSKIKKLIKAHGRYMKAQEDLKRSKGRFERLADMLASDSLKSGTKEQDSSVNAGNDDPQSAYEMSADDQGQKHGSKARKRSTALSTSEEEKSGKKRRVIGADMIHMSGKYRPEDALESFNVNKGTDSPKVLSLKKLREGGNNDEGIVVSSRNDFTDRYNGIEEDPVD